MPWKETNVMDQRIQFIAAVKEDPRGSSTSCSLLDRVKAMRRAARYVFRAHPDVARKFGSAYERRQRAARRKRVDMETETAGTALVTETATEAQ